jgi:MFS family permease
VWELTPEQGTWLSLSFALGYIIGWPVVYDTKAPKRDFLIGFLIAIVASLVFALTVDTVASAFIYRFIAGFGVGLMVLPAVRFLNYRSGWVTGLLLAASWAISVPVCVYFSQGGILSLSNTAAGWLAIYTIAVFLGVLWWLISLALLPSAAKLPTRD